MSFEDRSLQLVTDLELPSSLDSVDVAENHVIETAAKAGLSEDDTFRFGYAVREAMVNAVVHGNRYNSNKTVTFRLYATTGCLEVFIRDHGDGFNAGGVADPLAEENLLSQSGRGLALIKAFVDEIELSAAEGGGTKVILRKFVKAGTNDPSIVSE
jgi:serine/threonine-protein kinase RsbW